MFKWYFKWKFRRSHKAAAYKIDRRSYKPLFGPGFLDHLHSSRLWESNLSKYEAPHRRRRFAFIGIVIIVIAAGIWIIYESIQGINLF